MLWRRRAKADERLNEGSSPKRANAIDAKERPQPRVLKRSELLKLKPTRDPQIKWERDEEGLVRLETDRLQIGRRLLATLLRVPAKKRIQLDEVGSVVWELCDGEHTVEQIARELMRRYRLDKHEAEVSLMTFFQDLTKRRLVTLRTDAPQGNDEMKEANEANGITDRDAD